jgi:hypothetical protein
VNARNEVTVAINQRRRSEMKMKVLFWDFVANFSLAIVVAAFVTFFWSLIAHGSGVIDWETSFVLAVVLAAVLASQKWQAMKQ